MKKSTKATLWWVAGLAVLAGLVYSAWSYMTKQAMLGPKTPVPLTGPAGAVTSTVDVPATALARYKDGSATEAEFATLGEPFAAEVILNWLRLKYMGPLTTANPYLGASQTAFVSAANAYLKSKAGKPTGWASVADYVAYCESILTKYGQPGVYPTK